MAEETHRTLSQFITDTNQKKKEAFLKAAFELIPIHLQNLNAKKAPALELVIESLDDVIAAINHFHELTRTKKSKSALKMNIDLLTNFNINLRFVRKKFDDAVKSFLDQKRSADSFSCMATGKQMQRFFDDYADIKDMFRVGSMPATYTLPIRQFIFNQLGSEQDNATANSRLSAIDLLTDVIVNDENYGVYNIFFVSVLTQKLQKEKIEEIDVELAKRVKYALTTFKEFFAKENNKFKGKKEQFVSTALAYYRSIVYKKSNRAAKSETRETSTPVGVYVDQLKENVHYKWSSFDVSDLKYKKDPYGPGEQFLAKIFAGSVQGSKLSFDLYLPHSDGKSFGKYEVKEIATDTALVRPGTEGRALGAKMRAGIDVVMTTFKASVDLVRASRRIRNSVSKDVELHTLYLKIEEFLDSEYDNILLKGEISRDRFADLKAIIELAQRIVLKSKIKAPNIEVSVNKQIISLTSDQLYKFYVILSSGVGDDTKILDTIDERSFFISTLSHIVSIDAEKFIKDLDVGGMPSNLFKNVVGIFIVDSEGFSYVSKPNFDRRFVYNSISQGVPKYAYVNNPNKNLKRAAEEED